MAKQVKFIDHDNNVIHGGILDWEGNIICGCCGGLIEADEIGEGESHEILKVYDTWVSIEDAIIGKEY